MAVLNMYRGDSKTMTETVQPLDSNGNPVLTSSGLTGWSFWMTAKVDAADPDSAAVFQKIPAQWVIQTPGNATTPGVVTCNIAPADTASLPAYRNTLVYDVQAKDTNGNVFTLDNGTLIVDADVTVATT